MTEPGKRSLILDIQSAATEANPDVAALLRRAKLAAVKLDQLDAVTWIDAELDGYFCGFDELPDYRKTYGILKAKYPYHGLRPIFLQHEETNEILTRAPLTGGVGALQKVANSNADSLNAVYYDMAQAHRDAILKLFNVQVEPILLLSQTQFEGVLSRVISMVLNWALDLEKAGILGEGLSFDTAEKQKAGAITFNTITAQNIGQVGSATESASVTVSQEVAGSQNIDNKKLETFCNQAKKAIPLLPPELQKDATEILRGISANSSTTEKQTALKSLKVVLEGATGNITAQGILQLIGSFF